MLVDIFLYIAILTYLCRTIIQDPQPLRTRISVATQVICWMLYVALCYILVCYTNPENESRAFMNLAPALFHFVFVGLREALYEYAWIYTALRFSLALLLLYLGIKR